MPSNTNDGSSRPSSRSPTGDRSSPGGQLSPHDAIVRYIFAVPENMASQLRAVLPPDLAGQLDLRHLTPVPGTFVDESLKQRHSDLLFTAPLDGRDAFIYVLVEHQSRSDPLMAYRMLRYITRIWDTYLAENPRARRLPAVIPLVVQTGGARGPHPGGWKTSSTPHPAPGKNPRRSTCPGSHTSSTTSPSSTPNSSGPGT